MKLPKKVEVMDVTLRDGFQHEEMFVPTEAKLWIANKLIDAGFTKFEVGTFSHIKYVPQFKDIEAVLKGLPKNENVEYTVLALNTKACERTVQALEDGAQIDRVLCGQLATSEAYARKNMNRTHEELFAEAEKNVKFLHDHGVKKVFANIGTIFGCPIQGEVPLERPMNSVTDALISDSMRSNIPIRMELQIRRKYLNIFPRYWTNIRIQLPTVSTYMISEAWA